MPTKLELLLRKVFLSSIGGLFVNSTSGQEIRDLALTDFNDIDQISLSKNFDLKPKLVLKLVSGSEWKFTNHRSHRSHSSHSSHRSHYSSSSNPSPANNNDNSNTKTLPTNYALGSRILKLGMKGLDVTELINILIKKKYVILEDNSTELTGEYLFDETVEKAVKAFQKDNSLTETGIVDSTTVFYLKNK